MFEKINNLVSNRMNKHGFREQAEAARICFEADKLYSHLFNVISFRDGVLTVSVKNNIEAQQIQMQSKKIIDSLNKKLENDIIKRIKFRVL